MPLKKRLTDFLNTISFSSGDLNVKIDDIGQKHLDMFHRLRTSEPNTIFDSKQLHDKLPLFWDESITDGSGNATSTHSTTDASTTMHVESGDTIIRQTKTHWGYQPGKSQFCIYTANLLSSGSATGVKGRVGSFTATDGVFWEYDAGAISAVVRKGSSDTKVASTAFNFDTLDGSGPSGVTLDPTKTQILWIAYEWLGVGSVAYGIFIDANPIIAHITHHANIATSVYMATPNLPVRYEISSTSATAEMQHICSTVISEGGSQENGPIVGDSLSTTVVEAGVANTIYAIMGLRLKSTHLDATVRIEDFNLLDVQGKRSEYFIAVNPTIAGAFAWTDVANSACQTGRSAGGTQSAETVTADSWDTRFNIGYLSTADKKASRAGGDVPSALALGSTIGGTPDEFVLCIKAYENNPDVLAAINWRE